MANLVSCGRRLWVRAARVFVAVVVAEGVCMRRLLIILPLDARVGTIDVAIPSCAQEPTFQSGRFSAVNEPVNFSVYGG